jgi:hypothetical protein
MFSGDHDTRISWPCIPSSLRFVLGTSEFRFPGDQPNKGSNGRFWRRLTPPILGQIWRLGDPLEGADSRPASEYAQRREGGARCALTELQHASLRSGDIRISGMAISRSSCQTQAHQDDGDRLHYQHPQTGSHVPHGSHCGPTVAGVPIGCRSPRKRSPYSMPIHTLVADRPCDLPGCAASADP